MAYFGMTNRVKAAADSDARGQLLKERDERAKSLPANVVAFGSLLSDDQQAVDGYAYFIDTNSEAEARDILARDPLIKGGCEEVSLLSRWKRAWGVHQSTIPTNKDNPTGLLFLGFGKPNIHPKRDTLLDAHLKYLAGWDKDHIIARGAFFPPEQDIWVGSVIAFELPDVAAFHRYLNSEPFVLGDLYERTTLKPWVRATSSSSPCRPEC